MCLPMRIKIAPEVFHSVMSKFVQKISQHPQSLSSLQNTWEVWVIGCWNSPSAQNDRGHSLAYDFQSRRELHHFLLLSTSI
jgi:hypothetical protein